MKILHLLLAFSIAVFLISCDSDSTGPNSNGLVGTWEFQQFIVTVNGQEISLTPEMLEMEVTITLNSDGTLSAITREGSETRNESGTWSTEGNNLTLIIGDETISGQYTLEGNSLRFSYNETFEDSDLSGFSGTVIMVFNKR